MIIATWVIKPSDQSVNQEHLTKCPHAIIGMLYANQTDSNVLDTLKLL